MESQVLEWKPGAQARIHPTAACEYMNVKQTHDRSVTAGTDSFLVLFWDYGILGKAAFKTQACSVTCYVRKRR